MWNLKNVWNKHLSAYSEAHASDDRRRRTKGVYLVSWIFFLLFVDFAGLHEGLHMFDLRCDGVAETTKTRLLDGLK